MRVLARRFFALALLASFAGCRAILSIDEKELAVAEDAAVTDAPSDGTDPPDVATDAPASDGCIDICSGACVDLQSATSSCGYCGHDCKGACDKGRCVGRITQELGAAFTSLARGNMDLYVGATNSMGGRIRRLKGGTELTLASGLGDGAHSIYRDPWVYFAAPVSGRIARVKIDGSETTELASGEVGAGYPAISGLSLYYANANGEIRKVPSTGGGPSELVVGNVGANTSWIVIDATHVFWVVTVGQDRGLWRYDLNGGGRSKIYPGTVTALAEAGAKLFVADANAGAIVVVGKGDGAKTAIAQNQAGLGGIDVDGSYVWFTTADGTVSRVPISGASPVQPVGLAAANPTIVIASDPNELFWHAGTRVFSAPK